MTDYDELYSCIDSMGLKPKTKKTQELIDDGNNRILLNHIRHDLTDYESLYKKIDDVFQKYTYENNKLKLCMYSKLKEIIKSEYSDLEVFANSEENMQKQRLVEKLFAEDVEYKTEREKAISKFEKATKNLSSQEIYQKRFEYNQDQKLIDINRKHADSFKQIYPELCDEIEKTYDEKVENYKRNLNRKSS